MARVMDRSNQPLVAAFADALRDARHQAGLTQEGLAERADVSVRFVSLLENAQRQPSLSALAAVSAGLGITLSTLVIAVEERLASGRRSDS
jgi:transcriptional regulator with XRE-family HTH domain